MKYKTFKATDDALASATDFITEELENSGANMKTVMQVSVVLEEIFVNVAHYAYGENIGDVDIGYQLDDADAVIQFKDNGKPFDPFAKEDPDITLSAEDRAIGGLGIFMTKQIMDKYDYEYKDGYNIVTLRKKI